MMLRTHLRRSVLSAGLLLLFALHASAQTTLVNELAAFLDPAEGVNGVPSEYTEGPDGMLYGIADRSNTRFGSIFRLNPDTNARSIVAQVDYGPGAGTVGAGSYSGRMVLAADGRLYGTFIVFDNNDSAIFRFDPATSQVSVIHSFPSDPITGMPGPDGINVQRLTLGSDGWLYGTTMLGEDPVTLSGTIFKIDPATETFVTLMRPSLADGFYPSGPLLESAPGVWIGNYVSNDSAGACGLLFRIDTSANTFAHLKSFFYEVEGCSSSYVSLARAADGSVYGTAEFGGGAGDARGAFFKLDPNTGAYTQLHHFAFDDAVQRPHADLTVGDDGLLYAGYMTPVPGSDFEKGLMRLDPSTGIVTKLAALPAPEGVLGESGFFMGRDGRWFGGTSSPWMTYAIGILDGVTVAPASVESGAPATLSATLKTIGVPVAGAVIDFTLNGNAVGSATTDTNGVATLSGVSVNGAAGTYASAIGAAFAGDSHFPSASGFGSLTVTVTPPPPPPPPTATPGLMYGLGYIRDNSHQYEFAFLVRENASGADRGGFELRVSQAPGPRPQAHRKQSSRSDRFVARAFTNVVFSDDPTIRPGRSRRPQVDTVSFAGAGEWNGRTGYRFEAVAQDNGESWRHRETLKVTVYDSANRVVVTFDSEIDAGNVESVRLHR